MDDRRTIRASVDIDAPVQRVWDVFADPRLTRRLGGEYVTDWRVGGEFSFRTLDGDVVARGELLALEPLRLLRHSLLATADDATTTVLTYEFEALDGGTRLTGSEEFPRALDEVEYADDAEGWAAALAAVKDAAEQREQ